MVKIGIIFMSDICTAIVPFCIGLYFVEVVVHAVFNALHGKPLI